MRERLSKWSSVFRNLTEAHRFVIDFGGEFFPVLYREGLADDAIELDAFMSANVDGGDEPSATYLSCLNLMDMFLGAVLHGTIGLRIEFEGAYDHEDQVIAELRPTFEGPGTFEESIQPRLRCIVFVLKKDGTA